MLNFSVNIDSAELFKNNFVKSGHCLLVGGCYSSGLTISKSVEVAARHTKPLKDYLRVFMFDAFL